MTISVVLVLILLGLLLILIELFLVPGTTVVGFVGFGMTCVGVYGSFEAFGTVEGIFISIGTLAISLVGLVIAIKTNAWKIFALNKVNNGTVEKQNQSQLEVGQVGVTISDLRPGGTVSFDDKYFEVFSTSAFVEVGQKVKITTLKTNKIFVEAAML